MKSKINIEKYLNLARLVELLYLARLVELLNLSRLVELLYLARLVEVLYLSRSVELLYLCGRFCTLDVQHSDLNVASYDVKIDEM